MSGQAHVDSFEAVRDFRAALIVFLHEAREALGAQDLEVRRTLEWLLDVEPRRWQQEVRNCEEGVVQAKIDLERCRHTTLPGGETPSCIEERKALERARQRRAYAEQKVEAVRRWGLSIDHDAGEYTARAGQLGTLFDVDLAAAVALLDRVLTSLEAYAALRAPEGAGAPPVSPASAARSGSSSLHPDSEPKSTEQKPTEPAREESP